MDKALPTQPVSKFRQASNEIIEDLSTSPVLLTQHGIGVGVLLSIELYNSMISYIRAFDDTELIRRRLLEMGSDERSFLTFSQFDDALNR